MTLLKILIFSSRPYHEFYGHNEMQYWLICDWPRNYWPEMYGFDGKNTTILARSLRSLVVIYITQVSSIMGVTNKRTWLVLTYMWFIKKLLATNVWFCRKITKCLARSLRSLVDIYILQFSNNMGVANRRTCID